MNEAGLVHDSEKLRRLIAENPDLPIVVLAGEEANSGDWYWMYCTDVDCGIDSSLISVLPTIEKIIFLQTKATLRNLSSTPFPATMHERKRKLMRLSSPNSKNMNRTGRR